MILFFAPLSSSAPSAPLSGSSLLNMHQRAKRLTLDLLAGVQNESFIVSKEAMFNGKVRLHLIAKTNDLEVVPVYSRTVLYGLKETFANAKLSPATWIIYFGIPTKPLKQRAFLKIPTPPMLISLSLVLHCQLSKHYLQFKHLLQDFL